MWEPHLGKPHEWQPAWRCEVYCGLRIRYTCLAPVLSDRASSLLSPCFHRNRLALRRLAPRTVETVDWDREEREREGGGGGGGERGGVHERSTSIVNSHRQLDFL